MSFEKTLYTPLGFIILALILCSILIIIYYSEITQMGIFKSKVNSQTKIEGLENSPANMEKLNSVAGMVKKLYEDKEFMNYMKEKNEYNKYDGDAIYT